MSIWPSALQFQHRAFFWIPSQNWRYRHKFSFSCNSPRSSPELLAFGWTFTPSLRNATVVIVTFLTTGVMGPLLNGRFMAYKWWLLTTYPNWAHPPSSLPSLFFACSPVSISWWWNFVVYSVDEAVAQLWIYFSRSGPFREVFIEA